MQQLDEMDFKTDSQGRFSPDGLTAYEIRWMFAERLAADAPRPTSALLDGSALEQREHRQERREAKRLLSSRVRVLRVQAVTSVPFGTEAA
ncbi:hypothetical protein SAMN04488074_12487 [Lentzea albidocapillata subsp. violacea]|uniref:Uncharacterized protein n=1 Tax=Lentzea albidocapillata subsp. violacea TaxID=128104 RepID=A0A1G9UTQ9_9PSEU|nr:hypothetical protein [Lentzea albidocapillata]SDM63290.1 hypothetical protein SAMN04488074_12487 [Lentzea albidocapillata subsp. violacea]